MRLSQRRIFIQLTIIAIFILSAAIVEASDDYIELPQENLIYLSTNDGTAIIELAPWIAPAHVMRFKQLAQNNRFAGANFYRVVEGFVAQGGFGALADQADRAADFAPLKLEPFRKGQLGGYSLLNTGGHYADAEGIYNGFNVSNKNDEYWVNHCYGVVAAARMFEADTATTEFYIMIGAQARHLDRNMSVFGRVVHGMDVIQRVNRGVAGQAKDFEPTTITAFQIGSDLPASEQVKLYVMRSGTKAFEQSMSERKQFSSPFFAETPPPVINPCRYTQALTELPPTDS